MKQDLYEGVPWGSLSHGHKVRVHPQLFALRRRTCESVRFEVEQWVVQRFFVHICLGDVQVRSEETSTMISCISGGLIDVTSLSRTRLRV